MLHRNYSAGIGGPILARGRTRLYGLTPGQAPPTSHQILSCSHQVQNLSVAPDPNPNIPFSCCSWMALLKASPWICWASSSRKTQAGALTQPAPGCRLHSGRQPTLRWSPNYSWLSHSLFLWVTINRTNNEWKHHKDATGTYHQWCSLGSTGVSGLATSYTLAQVTQPGLIKSRP